MGKLPREIQTGFRVVVHHPFQTSNGITQHHSGYFPTSDTGELSASARGTFSYLTPDNTLIEVQYTSDDNGYHPHVSTKLLGSSYLDDHRFVDTVTPKAITQPNIDQPVVPGVLLEGKNVTTVVVPQSFNDTQILTADGIFGANVTKQVSPEFPNRIGQNAIISLQGPPG